LSIFIHGGEFDLLRHEEEKNQDMSEGPDIQCLKGTKRILIAS
jgi:hypothetical protein